MRCAGFRLLALPLLVLLWSQFAYGQYSSNLEGVVIDPSRAVIPGATVQITNTATGVASTATTDGGGNYRFNSLAPGDYEVLVSASGFKPTNVKFTLLTGQTVNLPVTLTLAGTRQTVEVTGQVPLLDTADSRQQMTVESQEFHSLPLQGNNFFGLAAVTPGVTGLGVLIGSSPGSCPSGLPSTIPDNFATEMPVEVATGGKGEESNSFLLDGLDITSDINGGITNLSPNPDAIQEMSVETNDYSVEYGRNSSVTIKMTTKSGTDRYHGSASDLFTDQYLWARSEFTGPSYPPFVANNFSGSIGGPLIPGHHTYFFASVEPLRSTFSTGNQAYSFQDPQFVTWARQNFPNTVGTQILTQYPISPAAIVTSVAETAQNVLPGTCGTPATANIPCSLPMLDSGTYEASPYRNGLALSGRIDQYFGKDRLYGNFNLMRHNDETPSIVTDMTTKNHYDTNSLQVNETHTFSANTLNEGMFGYLRPEGVPNLVGPFSVPTFGVVGITTSYGVGYAQSGFVQHNYRWRDVLTTVRGTHTFKFGYEGWRGNDLTENWTEAYSQPSFVFENLLNLVEDNAYSETQLAYNPLTGKPALSDYGFVGMSEGLFAQDTWKVKPNLTLSLGLRWDVFPNPHPVNVPFRNQEVHTVLANFFLGTGSTQDEQVANGIMKQVSHVYNSSVMPLSPRVGFAWDPTGKGQWAIRGGFGVYSDWLTLGMSENQLKGNPPGWIVPTFLQGTTNPPIFALGTSNTYPFGYPYPTLAATTLDAHGGLVGDQLSVGGMDPNLSAPRTFNYSLSVERRLPGKLMASAAYSGSHSIEQVTGSVMNQFRGTDINRFAGDLIEHDDVLTRLLSSFGAINYATNGATATYNALILSLERRFGNRVVFTSSYMRSSAWYDGQQYPNQHDIAQYWQPSLFDAPNRFSFAGTLMAPTPRISYRPLRFVLDGWQFSPTTILQSGYPFTVYTNAPFEPVFNAAGTQVIGMQPGSGDYQADGYNYAFPDVPSFGYNMPSRSRQAYLNGLFPASAFPVPAMGTYGDLKPGLYRGPGFADVDLAVLKNNRLTERVNLELRFDFFNLFNRPNLNGVDSNLPDATFGQSISVFNPRWLQLGMKLTF